MNLLNLDAEVRALMLSEFEIDVEKGILFESSRLTPEGAEKYPELLRNAIVRGDINSFERSLSQFIKSTEQRKKPKGGITIAKVPRDAARMLAEGEFNRFYIRAICIKAIQNNTSVIVYRAKEVANPRAESEALIGNRIEPQKLLDDLRKNIGVDTALGVPAGPNSGLSVKFSL